MNRMKVTNLDKFIHVTPHGIENISRWYIVSICAHCTDAVEYCLNPKERVQFINTKHATHNGTFISIQDGRDITTDYFVCVKLQPWYYWTGVVVICVWLVGLLYWTK